MCIRSSIFEIFLILDHGEGHGINISMKKAKDLENILWRIDGKGYKAYKDIKGEYAFRWYTLFIDHVQGDPYAAPSRVRVRVERKSSGFLPETTSNRSRQVALYYVLTRDFHINCKKYSRAAPGGSAKAASSSLIVPHRRSWIEHP